MTKGKRGGGRLPEGWSWCPGCGSKTCVLINDVCWFCARNARAEIAGRLEADRGAALDVVDAAKRVAARLRDEGDEVGLDLRPDVAQIEAEVLAEKERHIAVLRGLAERAEAAVAAVGIARSERMVAYWRRVRDRARAERRGFVDYGAPGPPRDRGVC